MAGKGGGAWKVAYADFVTAMMAFFMVMWLTSQKPDVKEAVAHYFQNPDDPFVMEPDPDAGPTGTGGGGGGGSSRNNGKPKNSGQKTTPSNKDDAKNSKKPRVPLPRPNEILGAGTVVYFNGNSIELDDSAKQLLDHFAPTVVGKPQKIEVRGHAMRSRSSEDNAWKLSYERCIATMQYLESLGIPEKQIRLSQAGANERLTLKIEGNAQKSNPRVEIIVLGELAEDFSGTPNEREKRFQDENETIKPEDAASTTKEAPSQPVAAPAPAEAGAQTTERPTSTKAG